VITPGLSTEFSVEQSAKYPLSACDDTCGLRAREGLPTSLGGVCHSIRRRLEGAAEAVSQSANLFCPISELDRLGLNGKLLGVDGGAESIEQSGSGVECPERASMSACTPTVLCFMSLFGLLASVCMPTDL